MSTHHDTSSSAAAAGADNKKRKLSNSSSKSSSSKKKQKQMMAPIDPALYRQQQLDKLSKLHYPHIHVYFVAPLTVNQFSILRVSFSHFSTMTGKKTPANDAVTAALQGNAEWTLCALSGASHAPALILGTVAAPFHQTFEQGIQVANWISYLQQTKQAIFGAGVPAAVRFRWRWATGKFTSNWVEESL